MNNVCIELKHYSYKNDVSYENDVSYMRVRQKNLVANCYEKYVVTSI